MTGDAKYIRFSRKSLGIVLMIGIVFLIILSLNLSYFSHLDALLLILVGTIGYALANSYNKTVFANIADGAVYFSWIGVLIAGITIAFNGFIANKL